MIKVHPSFVYLTGLLANVFTLTFIKYLGVNNLMKVDQIIFFRTLFSLLIVTPLSAKQITRFKVKDRRTVFYLLMLGLLASADGYLWNIGLQKVPINNAMILLFFSPVVTATLSGLLLKEKMSRGIKLSLATNSLAILFIYQFSIGSFSVGYVLIMLDFLVYSFSAMLIKKLANYSALFLLFVRLAILLPISFIVMKEYPKFDLGTYLSLGIITLGYITERTLMTKAYQMTDIVAIQPLRYFNVIFSAALSYIMLGERLDMWQVFGIAIIFATNFFIKDNGRLAPAD